VLDKITCRFIWSHRWQELSDYLVVLATE